MSSLHPGQEMLDHIRALAEDQCVDLAPLTISRFDGVERITADETAIARHKVYAGIVDLVDAVCSDPVFLVRACRVLGKR